MNLRRGSCQRSCAGFRLEVMTILDLRFSTGSATINSWLQGNTLPFSLRLSDQMLDDGISSDAISASDKCDFSLRWRHDCVSSVIRTKCVLG